MPDRATAMKATKAVVEVAVGDHVEMVDALPDHAEEGDQPTDPHGDADQVVEHRVGAEIVVAELGSMAGRRLRHEGGEGEQEQQSRSPGPEHCPRDDADQRRGAGRDQRRPDRVESTCSPLITVVAPTVLESP